MTTILNNRRTTLICKRAIGALVIAVIAAGCSPTLGLQQAEQGLLKAPEAGGVALAAENVAAGYWRLNEFSDQVTYAGVLAETYVQTADRLAQGQDLAALGLIASAATAVGGLVFSGPDVIALGAGLAGGVIGAGANYIDAPGAAAALLDASQQLVCVAQAGQPSLNLDSVYKSYAGHDAARKTIISGGITTARTNLRRAMIRQTPDFAALFSSLRQAASTAGGDDAGADSIVAEVPGGGGAGAQKLTEVNDKMREDVAACFLPEGLADAARTLGEEERKQKSLEKLELTRLRAEVKRLQGDDG